MANGKDTQAERLVTFRVPVALADQFTRAVKADDLDVSKALRRYMREVVERAERKAA